MKDSKDYLKVAIYIGLLYLSIIALSIFALLTLNPK